MRNVPEHRLEYFDLNSRAATLIAERDEWLLGLTASPDEQGRTEPVSRGGGNVRGTTP